MGQNKSNTRKNSGGLGLHFYFMKRHRFDFIRKWALGWSSNIPITKELVSGLPLDIQLPWVDLDKMIPARDHYGEVIENFPDYHAQREAYIDELIEEINRKKREGTFDREKELQKIKEKAEN